MKLSRRMTNNRSGILFGVCWLLCSFLLQVSTSPHDDAWGWLGGEPWARCSFSQDDVKIEEQVSRGKIRLAALVSNPTWGSRCGVVTPLHRGGRVSTSTHVKG